MKHIIGLVWVFSFAGCALAEVAGDDGAVCQALRAPLSGTNAGR